MWPMRTYHFTKYFSSANPLQNLNKLLQHIGSSTQSKAAGLLLWNFKIMVGDICHPQASTYNKNLTSLFIYMVYIK